MLVKYTKSGDIREKVHLFSSRTQKLSFSSPKILDWRRSGKIGHCQITKKATQMCCLFFALLHNANNACALCNLSTPFWAASNLGICHLTVSHSSLLLAIGHCVYTKHIFVSKQMRCTFTNSCWHALIEHCQISSALSLVALFFLTTKFRLSSGCSFPQK